MPNCMRKTSFTGTVSWLGIVQDSSTDIRAQEADFLSLTFAGQEGECHSGLTRPSCSRVLEMYPKGTIIRNVRQLSILSDEEISEIASTLGTSHALDPSSLGASMVIKGIPDFSRLPPNSRLITQSGATITVDMENGPCMYTGQVVHSDHPEIGHWNRFKPAAVGKRGVTAWVEREGIVSVGDTVQLFVPEQRPWLYHHHSSSAIQMSDVTMHMIYMLISGVVFALLVGVYNGL